MVGLSSAVQPRPSELAHRLADQSTNAVHGQGHRGQSPQIEPDLGLGRDQQEKVDRLMDHAGWIETGKSFAELKLESSPLAS